MTPYKVITPDTAGSTGSTGSGSSGADAYNDIWNDLMSDGYQFGDIIRYLGGTFGQFYGKDMPQAINDTYLRKVAPIATKQGDGYPVSGSKVGSDTDIVNDGSDSDKYGSTDQSGFDQAGWTLEQQWKLDDAEREFNSAEAAKQRDWEKMMSDTAISRAVADIRKAGLNPWLALNGGSLGAASTPSGASASASSGSAKMPINYLMAMLSSLIGSASKIIAAFA